RHIREAGAMRAVLATDDADPDRAVARARASAGLVGRDLIREVACANAWTWDGDPAPGAGPDGASPEPATAGRAASADDGPLAVVIDYGVKYGILRRLREAGCRVRVVPAGASAEEIAAARPDGLMLSNGPGDPAAVPYAVETVRRMVLDPPGGRPVPVFGICMGHQVLCQALGGRTFKLKFGHHGANHPVKDLATGKVAITVQNHGFCVDIDSLAGQDVEVTHVNLNDQTLEGMQHRRLPAWSVQFHPEASPGPHDAHYLFARFVEAMRGAHA
ncbi:MAG: carbamoyl phosphate synthase small subunit, partial [Acidobacteria bacterium]|nr:carbamoyl phosphate synthase small subunit [Acidobacteriota bacterium]